MSDRRQIQRGFRQWECWRCDVDLGIKSSVGAEVYLAPMVDKHGDLYAKGTKTMVCAHCLARGYVTKIH